MFDLDKYLKERSTILEQNIVSYVPDCPAPTLSEGIRYSLVSGGKRIRPVLCMASWELCSYLKETLKKETRLDVLYNPIMPLACALEMIHTYSLIHDDLPAMDNDDLRRGRPTNHKVYGEARAILAGDALLTEAFAIITKLSATYSADRVLKALSVVAEAAGMFGMVGGQVLDIENDGSNKIDDEYLYTTNMCKTGALLKASVVAPAILLGADDEAEIFEKYGEAIGIAFQIVDDILGVTATKEQLGKSIGIDVKNNKVTYVDIHGVKGSKEKARAEISKAKELLYAFGDNQYTEPFSFLADFILSRTF